MLPYLPDVATTPEVVHRDGGYVLSLHYYTALLTVYRDDAPVAPASDVASPAYRTALDNRFRDNLQLQSEGAPTSIGGVSGWTVVRAAPAQRGADPAGPTHYLCLTYVIVQRHLYRLSVTADGTDHRPPEFDGLVRLLSRIRFTTGPASAPPGSAGAS